MAEPVLPPRDDLLPEEPPSDPELDQYDKETLLVGNWEPLKSQKFEPFSSFTTYWADHEAVQQEDLLMIQKIIFGKGLHQIRDSRRKLRHSPLFSVWIMRS